MTKKRNAYFCLACIVAFISFPSCFFSIRFLASTVVGMELNGG
jgi:hypothetical protein